MLECDYGTIHTNVVKGIRHTDARYEVEGVMMEHIEIMYV